MDKLASRLAGHKPIGFAQEYSSIPPQGHNVQSILEPSGGKRVGKLEIEKASAILRKYKDGKASLEQTIISNDRWYRLRHWQEIKHQRDAKTNVQPASAWLFNSLANKHADAMDNYPEPNILPRERGDEQDAKSLSSVIPCVLEHNNFEQCYSDHWWYKLKAGTGAYGVFWDTSLENGLGDVKVRNIDILNIFWEPGIRDIQDSRNLFVVNLVDDDVLHDQYPDTVRISGSKIIDIAQYAHEDYVDTTQKSVVVDWYYKVKRDTGETVLHYVKFVGDTVLYASEDDPQYADDGYYAHGMYPVVFDTLFPEEDSPAGFGYINIMRDPQMYIDKLNQIILQNAYISGKPRYFYRKNAGINKEQFANWEEQLIETEGSLSDENVRRVETQPLPPFIAQHLEYKVNELKETSGNRDFTQGGTTSGVTAAAAISALQEAGNKLSRDMLKASYRAYTQVVYLVIELIRQFYDESRSFRITGEQGGYEFIDYSNVGIRDQAMPPVEGSADAAPSFRRPVFDIRVKPQKSNPFNRLSQNELAKELLNLGAFNPQMADQSLAMLDMMDFEGKQKVVERVQQGQTLLNVIQQMRAEMDKMAFVISNLTGKDMNAQEQPAQSGVSGGGQKVKSNDTGVQAQKRAANNAQGGYSARLAANAVPRM